jgi:energy-coupling factor transporter ATP-binding protein EcfA2
MDTTGKEAVTAGEAPIFDPGAQLADWANSKDEWARRIVRLVLASGKSLSDTDITNAYRLFLEEKRIEPRTIAEEPTIASAATVAEREEPLRLTRLSDVVGVNAIVPGSVVEFNEGITILFGENGTGKTGYARVLKRLANSRKSEEILGNIHDPSAPQTPSATLAYQLGSADMTNTWHGERGESPFTRMVIFDTLVVNYHVDEDAVYVYTPGSLALFKHVSQGIQGVQQLLNGEIQQLTTTPGSLLARFNRGSSIYPLIESLGAATDLEELKQLADVGADAQEKLRRLQLAVAALQTNTLPQQIKIMERRERAFGTALDWAAIADRLSVSDYKVTVRALAAARASYAQFRSTLFAAADLPAPPDETWDAFVRAGQLYRGHLDGLGAHDEARCLYCRQTLDASAVDLLSKYKEYLEDRIAGDIQLAESRLKSMTQGLLAASLTEVELYISEQEESDTSPELMALRTLQTVRQQLLPELRNGGAVADNSLEPVKSARATLNTSRAALRTQLEELRQQASNRSEELTKKEVELREFEARVELNKALPEIIRRVQALQRANRLTTLASKLPTLLRQVTDLSKVATNQLINQNFEALFIEECEALRAPSLQLEFVGREGSSQRRKVLTGKHRPSKVLSEGEQKVLALADFLAEARLTGITAPIIFDDPVCSLDYRRIDEVANRIVLLSQTEQVVVFTHDIFFATNLLTRFEKSKRCSYYQVTDEDGVGVITRATGPRWDTLNSFKKRINETIQAAKAEQGEARSALVRTGYSLIRSWCEVFVECELLQEVTKRYQPNIRMTALVNIKVTALPDAIKTVTAIFDDACRYIDGHSQPLPTLGVSPTLAGLEQDWGKLQKCRDAYLKS